MERSPLSAWAAPKYFIFMIGVIGGLLLSGKNARAQLAARFKADKTTGCGQLSVRFTDESTGNPSEWHWDFGNGYTSTQQNPATTYPRPGTYTVKLTVFNGVASNSTASIIHVYENPTVNFTLDSTSGCYPLPVHFTDNSTPGTGQIKEWTWDFGDGSRFSSQQNPSHIYDSAGTFDVKLTVTNSAGCEASSPVKQVVTNEGVTVNFTADKTFSCTAPFTVHFTASTSSTENISYHWDFGDGGTDDGKTAAHIYTKAGKYAVTLTAAVNGGGCRDQVIKKDYIYVENYTADFDIPQGCANVPLAFKNTSTPKPVSASWDFGDGKTSDALNPKHTYSAAGTYTVTLTSDFGGCQQEVKKKLTTYASPKAAFKADPQQYCGIPASATFQNLSAGASTWKWRFGDGDSSAAQQPQHDYKRGGDYDVTLIATSDQGCTDSVHKAGYIHVDAPDLDFHASPTAFGCVGTKSTFSVPGASDIAGYSWDFGDGGTSTDPNPTHSFNKEGIFDVKLSVVTKSGCHFSKTKAGYVHIGTKPQANFTGDPAAVCLDKPVQFTNTSSPEGDYWIWQFPDDGKNSSDSTENPSHTFSALGMQDVRLIVSNNGCWDTAFKAGYITVKPPQADFEAKLVSCSQPLRYQFTDKSTGGITSWTWDFGDGTTSNDPNPTHTYSQPGGKRVVLTVSNNNCSASDTTWIAVEKENPKLTVSAGSVCHGSKVTLSAGPFKVSNYVKTLVWFDGAGHSETTHDLSGDHDQHAFIYKDNGTFTPALKMTYVTGCTDSVTGDPVSVHGPTAGYTASQSVLCQGNTITFTDDSHTDPAGAAVRQWQWDFKDGSPDTVTTTGNIAHSFLGNGTFAVQLKVTDDNGCTDVTTGSQQNEVKVNPSLASFMALDTTVCPNTDIQWKDASKGRITNYLWTFGDGTTSTDAVPQKAYPKDGAYTVSLKITTDKGCVDSITRPDYITVGTPRAAMKDPGNVKICRIYKDTAISLSENYDNILWDFGDGTTSSGDTAYHIYNIPGTYTQKLVVNGYSPGCRKEIEKQVIIAGPIGTPVLTNAMGCTPLTVNFSAKDVHRAVSYQWFFGNGSTSPKQDNPDAAYTYTREGLFHPALKLTDDTGCYVIVPIQDTLTVIADSIGLQPAYSWPEICDSNTVKFNPKGTIFSVDSMGKTADFFWDFGDPANRANGVSDKEEPVYRYTAPGSYHALLKVTTNYGCKRTFPFDVRIPDSIALKAAVTASRDAICAGESVQLHASSNVGEHYTWSPVQGLNTAEGPDVKATPGNTTTYRVTAFNQGNCQSDTADVTVVVHPLPQVGAGPDQTASTGSVVQLQATGSTDVVQWKWTPADYLNCTDCAAPMSTPRRPITYTVTGTTGFGCSDSSSVTIHLVCDEGKVFIPNTFTPNNDGQNDIFYPRGRGVKTVLYFQIYNRFGQLVYEHTNFRLNDQSTGWDGTFKGKKLNPGVFVYAAEMICDDNKIFKLSGNITLLR